MKKLNKNILQALLATMSIGTTAAGYANAPHQIRFHNRTAQTLTIQAKAQECMSSRTADISLGKNESGYIKVNDSNKGFNCHNLDKSQTFYIMSNGKRLAKLTYVHLAHHKITPTSYGPLHWFDYVTSSSSSLNVEAYCSGKYCSKRSNAYRNYNKPVDINMSKR